jgi:hypothetical protein
MGNRSKDKLRLDDSATVVAASDLLSTDFGQEAVILHLGQGKYFSLADVGARVWSHLQRPITIGAICEAITAEYAVDPVVCRRDLHQLLRDLAERGLVEVREPAK